MAESEQGSGEQQGGGGGSRGLPKRQTDAARRLAAKRAAKAAAKASKRGDNVLIPDGVEENVEAAASWYEENSTTLWLALGAGLALGLGAVFVSEQMGKSGNAAAGELAAGVTTAIAPIVAEDATPKPEGVDETYTTATARSEKALEQYRAVLSAHGDGSVGPWARLGEASALYNLGKYQDAQQAYAKLLADADGAKGYPRWRALEGLGFALEAQEKYPEAQKRFEELAEAHDGALAPLGRYHTARMQAAQGQNDKAVDTLDALVKAESERPTADGKRFESVLRDAETLLGELAVATGRDNLKADIRGAAPAATPGQGAGGGGLTQEIVDALRKKLESKGESADGKGITKDLVEALQQNVNEGDTSTTLKIPADKMPRPPQQAPKAADAAPKAADAAPKPADAAPKAPKPVGDAPEAASAEVEDAPTAPAAEDEAQ